MARVLKFTPELEEFYRREDKARFDRAVKQVAEDFAKVLVRYILRKEGFEMPFTQDDIEYIFSYHPPTPDSTPQFIAIREAAKEFAKVVLANTKSCPDQSAAIRHIRNAVTDSNSAIALDGKY